MHLHTGWHEMTHACSPTELRHTGYTGVVSLRRCRHEARSFWTEKSEGAASMWSSSFDICGADSQLRRLLWVQTVRMLEGQAEGSMVAFKVECSQETTLTLRVRAQHSSSRRLLTVHNLMHPHNFVCPARSVWTWLSALQARTQREAAMWIQALNGAITDRT